MKTLLFLSAEGIVLYLADALHAGGDPIIYLAVLATSLGVLWRMVIRPARRAWNRVEEGIEKLDKLDPETLQALKSLPEWHQGLEIRMHQLERLVKR